MLATVQAQDIYAWQGLNFADDPTTVQDKMVKLLNDGTIHAHSSYYGQSYTQIARKPTGSFYPLSIAGVDLYLTFDFNDQKLYRLTFDTSTETAYGWDSTILPEYNTLRQVLARAQGQPSRTDHLEFFDMTPGFVTYGDIWNSDGVTHRLGIAEDDARYKVELVIEWDWMAQFMSASKHEEQQQSIDDAAEGF